MSAFRRKLPIVRFSLRTLLLLVTVFAVWLGVQLNRARQQQAAVRALREYGGWIVYDFEYIGLSGPTRTDVRPWEPKWLADLVGLDFFHEVSSVNLAWSYDREGKRSETEQSSGDVVANLESLPAVRSLVLQGPQASDTTMGHVAKLPALEELMIVTKYSSEGTSQRALRPRVTDVGIARLRELPRLRTVYVDDAALGDASLASFGQMGQLEVLTLQGPASTFTDEGLKQLAHLSRLRKLWFNLGYGCSEFTDAGLVHLKGLQSLEELSLRGGEISDRGLEQLTGLRNLKQLMISTNSATPEALRRFQAAVPGATCAISGYASFSQDLQKIISQVLRIGLAQVKPESTLCELGATGARHAKLIAFLRDDYFQFDDDNAENLREFHRRSADETLTVSQLADLIQQTVGR